MLGDNHLLLHLPHLSLGGRSSSSGRSKIHSINEFAFFIRSILICAGQNIFENYSLVSHFKLQGSARWARSTCAAAFAGLHYLQHQHNNDYQHHHIYDRHRQLDNFQVLSSPLAFPLTLFATIPLLILLAVNQSLFRCILFIGITKLSNIIFAMEPKI